MKHTTPSKDRSGGKDFEQARKRMGRNEASDGKGKTNQGIIAIAL